MECRLKHAFQLGGNPGLPIFTPIKERTDITLAIQDDGKDQIRWIDGVRDQKERFESLRFYSALALDLWGKLPQLCYKSMSRTCLFHEGMEWGILPRSRRQRSADPA